MVSSRAYPDWLERWWVDQACQQAETDDAQAAVSFHAGAVQVLSDLFTVARPQAGPPDAARSTKAHFPDYGADEELAVGYGLFYFPQSFVRVRLPLAEAIELRGWRPLADGEAPRPLRVLDLGAGAGAAGLGAALLLREQGSGDKVELMAVDNSADQLARLTTLVRENSGRLPGLRVRTVVQNALDWVAKELVREETPFDLIILGFALNEMLPAALGLKPRLELMQQLRRGLGERGLLLILEPSLRETAEPLQELSDALATKAVGATAPILPRWGPYLGGHRCPLRSEKVFWSHEVRRWTPPNSLALVNRKLWREIEEVKFAYALHGRIAPPELPEPYRAAEKAPDGLLVRLVSPFHLRKGGFVAAAVGTDGVKYTLDLQTRGMTKTRIAELEQIERGDVLALRDLKELGTPRLMRLSNPEAITARYHPQ
jgi:SAM-dependent methyltransferase